MYEIDTKDKQCETSVTLYKNVNNNLLNSCIMRRLFLFLTIISKSYTYKDVRTRDARKQIARLSIKRLLEEERKWTSSTFKSGHRICTRRSLYNGDGTARVKGAANASPLEINARVTGGRWLTHCPPTYPLRMGRLVKKIQM